MDWNLIRYKLLKLNEIQGENRTVRHCFVVSRAKQGPYHPHPLFLLRFAVFLYAALADVNANKKGGLKRSPFCMQGLWG